jgi:CPA2 family monovalent cation:H+ antiporter-2
MTGFLESGALLVVAAFMLVTICARIGIPSIVGYILTGLLIGPSVPSAKPIKSSMGR